MRTVAAVIPSCVRGEARLWLIRILLQILLASECHRRLRIVRQWLLHLRLRQRDVALGEAAHAAVAQQVVEPRRYDRYRVREARESLVDNIVVEVQGLARVERLWQVAAAHAAHLPDGSRANLRMHAKRSCKKGRETLLFQYPKLEWGSASGVGLGPPAWKLSRGT